MNYWLIVGCFQCVSLLAAFNLYRISKNQEREIAVLKAENVLLRKSRA